jgi:hypothetical protein
MSENAPWSHRGEPPRDAAMRHSSGKAARTMLGALRWWWAVGRHYRPERRYMRGGNSGAT